MTTMSGQGFRTRRYSLSRDLALRTAVSVSAKSTSSKMISGKDYAGM